MKKIDLTGKRSGRLVVIRFSHNKNKHNYWLCKCDCGNEVIIVSGNVNCGHTKSCGCLKNDTAGDSVRTHGMTKTPTYISWQMMKLRCYAPHRPYYYRYGGRGIKVCDRWLSSFENFLEDMGKRPINTTLDRKNNDKHYSPDNCRWATPVQQARNSSHTKLTEEKVRTIRFLSKNGVNKAKISRIFKVGETTIWSVINGRTWKNVK